MGIEELLQGCYVVCHFCKEGKFTTIDNETTTDFEKYHLSHGTIEIIPAQKFLSENLSSQYIDVDRPEQKSIGTSIGPVEKKDIIEVFKSSQSARMKYLQKQTNNAIKKNESYFPIIPALTLPVIIINKFDEYIFTKEDWLTPQAIKD